MVPGAGRFNGQLQLGYYIRDPLRQLGLYNPILENLPEEVYFPHMSAIIPAILPKTKEDLFRKLHQLQGIATEVQIDVIDGVFARTAPASWPYTDDAGGIPSQEELIPHLGPIQFEVDLMAREPEKVVGAWIRAGAQRITVHAESTLSLDALVADMRTIYGHDKDFAPGLFSFGLALGVSTDTALIEPYLSDCDYVQFMGIASIGKQGEPFDTKVIPKISAFHRKYPDMPIQVDGGVSSDRIAALMRAGASRLVVGSALWKAQSLAGEFARLNDEAQNQGVFG